MSSGELEAFNFLFKSLNIGIPSLVFSSIGVLIGAATLFLSGINYSVDFATKPNPTGSRIESYDFVIRAGSAGCVIANRLTAGKKKFKVIVLEAGGDPLVTNEVPYLTAYNIHRSETEWMYKLTNQFNSSYSYSDNAMPWVQGKSLGGSSNLNLMVHSRGNPNDFDNWANLTGDEQWAYRNVLPYFKKSEEYHGNFPNSQFHGSKGPLKINRNSYQPSIDQWIGGGQEMGYPSVDPNARQMSSFFPVDYTIEKGHRHGAYKAFLEPVLKKRNIKVVRNAQASKIDLSVDFKATGVTYKRNGLTFTVHARKEVIVCAGAIGSPKLLMLSGIGPYEHLKSVGVTPTVNLPGVGSNLQDHVSTLIGPFVLKESISMRPDRNISLAAAVEYTKQGTGPFTFSYVAGMGLVNTSNHPLDWPNIALYHWPIGIHKQSTEDISHFYGIKKEVIKEFLKDMERTDANFVVMSCGLPKSRGTVRLKSKDYSSRPLIDANYFGEAVDLIAMIEGFRLVVNMYERTATWNAYGARLSLKPLPGCEMFVLKSDQYFECYLRHFTASMWNPTSTCKMGRDDDLMSVVDSNLRVKYVSALRVADSSVLPAITNVGSNAATIMIAEKAADMIIQTWSN